jgi:DNA-binding XRE family transcriptional regulator
MERRDLVARRSRDQVAAWLEVHPAEIGKVPREGALALQGLIDAAQVATFNVPPERPRLEDLTVLARSLVAIGAGPTPATTADEASLKRFGERVRDIRTQRGRTIADIAARSGLHRTYISGVESGRRQPNLRNILKLARGLECPPSRLLDWV